MRRILWQLPDILRQFYVALPGPDRELYETKSIALT